VHHPFGGFREPGSPFNEQGGSGLRFFTRLKTAAARYAWGKNRSESSARA
jgi:alpha-ketoglutaric semialdehyde dehydrogenase